MKLLRNLILIVLAAAAVAAGVLVYRSGDPEYMAQEWLRRPSFWQYDELIRETAKRYKVDPALIKAVVWRESRFDPRKVGGAGERGLMQVTEGAAEDWKRAEKMAAFVPTDLFDAKVNLEAGSWYLARALEKWKAKDDPVPFALAEYNAGRGRVQGWIERTGQGERATAEQFKGVMDYPTTKRYIEEVSGRRDFYKRRGRL